MEAHCVRDEWKTLVCAVFTGVELSDGNGGLLVQGQIREILETNHNYPTCRKLSNRDYQYFPRVTALFHIEDEKDDIYNFKLRK